jgi:hypothetical protein
MKKNLSSLTLMVALMLMAFGPEKMNAQDMVSAVSNDGLEKTVSYDISKFTDIRDKKLEDIFKKMPGISTNEWGGVTYNGMFIEKIYVNGMDILEGNNDPVYNMKPEDVERLEITENHVSTKVMQGMQYSNSVAINVVLKDHANSKWSGSIKGGLGFKPLLLNADVNAINIGSKLQTTMLLKADNTGLDFSNGISGFGEYGYGGFNGYSNDNSGLDYSNKLFLNVSPSLAPLSPKRVRFNRSGIFNIGSTLKLNNNYQLNFQLTYHTDRLTADSFDETTYYLQGGDNVVDVTGEKAKGHQQDLQANITLLTNTEKIYLRNQLHFGVRWADVDKDITGSFPNDQRADMKPLLVYDDFLYKRRMGSNIFTLSSNIGFSMYPQDLKLTKEDGIISQDIKANSLYGELNAKVDRKMNDKLSLSVYAGAAGNTRELDMHLTGLDITPNIDSRLNVFNAYGGATLTYITERLQAEVKLPVRYGHYNLTDKITNLDMNKSRLYLLPSLSVKYAASQRLSLALDASYSMNEVERKNLYPNIVFNDFRTASAGLPNIKGNSFLSAAFQATLSIPEHSFFANGTLSYMGDYQALTPVMNFTDAFIINGYRDGTTKSHTIAFTGDVSKGISSLKGKIGIAPQIGYMKSSMDRNGMTIPYSGYQIQLSPYINGRLTSWWNVNYRLDFNLTHVKMKEVDTTSDSKSYTQTLEMIFNPWKMINFSILGEHYYTEFTDDVSKHLVLFDAKVECNLSERLQLILSVENLLNQKTYNYTLVDSDTFTKSYTSYKIRPRNILLSLYYKF